MRIGIAFSLAPIARPDDGPDDRFEEFDRPETVEAIASVLASEGHEVARLGDGRAFLERVLADPPDFVFNIAEGEGVGRNREARIPAVLEMLGIPCTGSDPLTLAASLDKAVAKRLVESDLVPVPRSTCIPAEIKDASDIHTLIKEEFGLPLQGPVILKPSFEGSSKGIRGLCVSDDADEVVGRVQGLGRDYEQPILIEEYIEGDEVTVGLVGSPAELMFQGSMRIMPRTPGPRFVYSLEVKRDWRRQVEYEAPATLPEPVSRRLHAAASAAYHALQCRDVARIDFRIARDGTPYFIEANPLPGLSPTTSDLVILARGHGIDFEELIRMILRAALRRCGLDGRGSTRS